MASPRGQPAWHDEFDSTALGRGVWGFDTARNRDGWSNNEKQYYAEAGPENIRVADGQLTIEARHESLSATAFPIGAYKGTRRPSSWQPDRPATAFTMSARSCHAGEACGRRSGCCPMADLAGPG
jgi:hypothetical protein